jgi:class 3 adenylate cyclase
MKKTVVELDLVGYSTIGDNLEQGLDVSSVAQLNQQIQSFIDAGLKAGNASRDEHVVATTGDGAILVFDNALDAHRFARAVHEATREHNRRRQQPLAKRVFRIGAASGEIVMQRKAGGGFDIAGTTIARAVRLEAKALPGGFLVDQETFEALGPEGQQLYGPKQVVAGKRDEVFVAHAWQSYEEGPKDARFFTKLSKEAAPEPIERGFGIDKRREVLEHFRRLKSNQYYDLIFLLEIPIGQRPAETLNLDQQKTQVLKWAEESDKLDLLLDELRKLAEPEGSARPM